MPGLSQPKMRRFGDVTELRNSIFDQVLKAVNQWQPVENERYRIEVTNFELEPEKQFTPQDYKKAIADKLTISRRLFGTVRFFDKKNNQLLEESKVTLALIPYLTDFGAFIVNGNIQPISHQLRLYPGVYTRVRSNGMISSQFNFLPGRGLPHQIDLEPETGVFKLRVRQAEIPAITLLKILGIDDETIRQYWGDQIYQANIKHHKDTNVERIFQQFMGRSPKPGENIRETLSSEFRKYLFEPFQTNKTLGVPFTHYNPKSILLATSKALRIARGEENPDDRENLVHSIVMGPEHLLAERINNIRARTVLNQILWKATNKGSIKNLLPSMTNVFNNNIYSLFIDSGLSVNPEGANALEFADFHSKITKLGEGGISGSKEAIAMSARNVHPSHFMFIDPIRTPESETIGVDLRIAFGTRLGEDNRLYAPFIQRKTGKIVFQSPQDLSDKVIGFPESLSMDTLYVPAIVKGELGYAKKDDIELVMPSFEQTFSPITSLVAGKSHSKVDRASMGGRMITQAMPLVIKEAPLFRTALPGKPDLSYERLLGKHAGAVFNETNISGTVQEVTDDKVTIRFDDGSVKNYYMFRYFPSGRKTGFHQTPVVQVGQRVNPGQLIIKSNYTDDNGDAVYGINVRAGFIHFKGKAFEDAIIVSESLAKKLTSEHILSFDWDKRLQDENVRRSLTDYLRALPGNISLEKAKNYDEDGIVKIGTVLQKGDPIMLGFTIAPPQIGQLSRSKSSRIKDASIYWDEEEPGTVVDVIRGDNRDLVIVQTFKQLKDGDKVANRYGSKGVVVVVPDDQMPYNKNGERLEVIFSPTALPGRGNPSALVELFFTKLAKKLGKPIIFEDFRPDQNTIKEILDLAKKEGIDIAEDLIEPETGNVIKGVPTGYSYIMKLIHMSESKAKGRGIGLYDETGQPLRGQTGKAMRASIGDTNALLSHGATKVIHDIHMYRGQANDEFWMKYMLGYDPGRPLVSKAFERFLNELRAAGINPVKTDTGYQLMALTDDDVKRLAHDREVLNGETIDLNRDGQPVPGGLFDPGIFGQPDSTTNWAKVTLPFRILNPVFQRPVLKLLNLTEGEFNDIISGKKEYKGLTGFVALEKALSELDIDKEIEKAKEDALNKRFNQRDNAIAKLKYLRGIKSTGITPDKWFLSAIPVLPPGFRPVSLGKQGVIVNSQNLLYNELIKARNNLVELQKAGIDITEYQKDLYDTVKAVFGLGAPLDKKLQEKNVKGILEKLLGDTSKFSYMQTKLLGTPIDLSGRAAVIPDPNLDMDQIGIPEDIAWDVYKPFVIRNMVRKGINKTDIFRYYEEKHPIARQALIEEMESRPVLATRYPVLHRYNVQAFRPVLVKGAAIRTNPFINKGYNLDHDGDSVVADHVIVSINGELFVGNFEELIRRIVDPYYDESKIQDLSGTIVYELNKNQDVCTLSIDQNGNIKWSKIAAITIHLSHDKCYEVTTSKGHKMIVTDQHSMLKVAEDGEIIPTTIYAIKPTELIPIVRKISVENIPNNGHARLPLDESAFSDDFWKCLGILYKNLEQVSPDKYVLSRSINNSYIEQCCMDAIEAMEHQDLIKVRRGMDKISIISEWFTLPSSSKDKLNLPEWLLYLKEENIERFIEGIMLSCAKLHRGLILIPDKCRENLIKIKILFSRLGLVTRINFSRFGRESISGKTKWALMINCKSIKHIWNRWTDDEKSLLSKNAKKFNKDASFKNVPVDYVPFPEKIANLCLLWLEMYKKKKNQDKDNRYISTMKRLIVQWKENRNCPRSFAQFFIENEKVNEIISIKKARIKYVKRWIDLVYNSNIDWDSIKNARKVERPKVTYDFTIDENNTFCIDGNVLTHNTMTISVPLSDDAVKEAYEKLLPSKMLFSQATFSTVQYYPITEHVVGIHYASIADDKNPPIIFNTSQEALEYIRQNKPRLGTRILIKNA